MKLPLLFLAVAACVPSTVVVPAAPAPPLVERGPDYCECFDGTHGWWCANGLCTCDRDPEARCQ